MSIGMTYNEYWKGPAELCKFYRKAFKLKEKRKNTDQWRQGAYIYNAMQNVAPLFRSLNKRGTKIEPYMAEPIPLDQEDIKAMEERRMRKQADEFRAYLAERNSHGRSQT